MRINKIVYFIGFFLLVNLSGCVSDTTHIQGSKISFDYPSSWTLEDNCEGNNINYILYPNGENQTDSDLLDPVTDQNLQIVILGPESPYNAFTLEGIMNSIIDSANTSYTNNSSTQEVKDPNFKILKNESITIDNMNGFDMIIQSSFNDKVLINEYVVLQDGNNFYEIRLDLPSNLTMNLTETKEYLEAFQTIVKSIKID
jgi:hypothetical protein